MNNEEKLIVREIQKGNKKVFKAIYDQYYTPLVLFASRYLHTQDLSEDVVQNFFIHFWENRNTLRLSGSIKSYCYTSVKNRCLNRLRDYNLRDEKNLIFLNSLFQLNIEVSGQDADFVEEVQKALEQLPDQMRQVFEKKYLEGMKTQEIASSMSVSANTVNTQLKRGKQKLRAILKDRGASFFVFL